MTRTARKNKNKEPLPATSWEELSSIKPYLDQHDNNDGTNTLKNVKDDHLKVTHKKKLENKLSAKTKTKLKSLTAKKLLKRSNSDCIQLIEPQLSEDSTNESQHERVNVSNTIDHKSTKHKELKKNTVQKRVPDETITRECDLDSVEVRKHKTKQVRKKRRKKQDDSEDKVCLIQHSSDSDSSLSDQVEMVQGDEEEYGDGVVCGEMESEGEYCEMGEDGDDKGSVEGVGVDEVEKHETSGTCEESEKERLIKTKPQKMKKRKRERKEMEKGELESDEVTRKMEGTSEIKKRTKKSSMRIKIGNRWVKASEEQDESMGGEVYGVEEEGTKRKRKRRMDEESRRKRVEHRKLRRQRKKVCFKCRQPGHWVGDCPLVSTSAGICFKCGSSEHTCQQCKVKVADGEFPYAKCFICGEIGHLSRSCPDNPRGLYPRGGGCKVCGSVEHLRANCPSERKVSGRNYSNGVSSASNIATTASANTTGSVDALDVTVPPPVKKKFKTGRKEKVVLF